MFVLARNAKGRPLLMHRVGKDYAHYTHCGYNLQGWSRKYLTARMAEPISFLLCKKCEKLP